MAYYNGYPATYPYQGYQYQPQTPQAAPSTPAQNSGLNWVQGEAAARSWLVAPGSSVLLMDSDESVFYIKTADASGMPLPLRVFDYKERAQDAARAAQPPTAGNSTPYATKADVDAIQGEINAIKSQIETMTAKEGLLNE